MEARVSLNKCYPLPPPPRLPFQKNCLIIFLDLGVSKYYSIWKESALIFFLKHCSKKSLSQAHKVCLLVLTSFLELE